MREKPAASQSEPEDQVRLKPVLGIRPGVYLAVLYSVILLGVLFFILIFPGLRNPGALVLLKTEPAGAAVRVDGVYMGTSPDRIFVRKGRRSLELVLPGFITERVQREIPGRVFGSALFPLRYPLEVKLNVPDPVAAFALAAADYAAWSFGGEPTAAWQIPLSLSEGAYRVGPAAASAAAVITELLKASARFTVTRAALRDMVRAKIFLDNGGLSPSPASLFNSAADIAGFLSENSGSAEWLANVLPPEFAAMVTASGWYKKGIEDPVRTDTFAVGAGPAPPAIRLEGLSFTGVSGGLMLCDTEVPASLYERFLSENPQWRPPDEAYTVSRNSGETGVTSVSWYAAGAFCQWLGERLPASMAGWEVRLPAEAEWEYVAGHIAGRPETAWEWCADPWAPLEFIQASPEAIALVGSPERAVRSGPQARSSLPPETRSPLVSFRPAIALKTLSPEY
jgi:hypothetical protein